jgi:predicted PurR-regulated permease PerM
MIKWIAMFILLWFIYQVRDVFPPIIVGAIIAYLLLPLVNSLAARAEIPVSWATLIVYSIFASVAGFAAWWLIPGLVREAADLANSRHDIIQKVVQQVTHMSDADAGAMADQILQNVTENFKPSEIAHLGGTISHGALAILVCVVSSIYITIDSVGIGHFLLRYLPENRRDEAKELAGQANRLLSKYVQGQLILIALMSSFAFFFLHMVMHMKYALPVALLSGFLEIIPVLGPILAIGTAMLVGFWQIGAQAAIIIFCVYTVARWVEDYVVVPRLIGHAVELHPLAVIFAVLCGERLAGALGMLIAIPVAACIKLFIDFVYFPGKRQCAPAPAAAGQQAAAQPSDPDSAKKLSARKSQ